MWSRPWLYNEGLTVGAGLVTIGTALQWVAGPIKWQLIALPANIILLILLIIFIFCADLFRENVYFFRWLSGGKCAVCSIAWTVAMTTIMGLVKQVPGEGWFMEMLSAWPFVLVFLWMTISLGMVTIKSIFRFEPSKIPFILNHLGLFVAIVAGVASSADMERYKMTVRKGNTEWRAVDNQGNLHELPLAIDLKDFRIDEFPAKIFIADNLTGQATTDNIIIEDGTGTKVIGNWKIEVTDYKPYAAPIFPKDSASDMRYNEFHSIGGTDAAYIIATNGDNVTKGWVSSGSFAFPMKTLKLDSMESIVMPQREPRRYVSYVHIYTKNGKSFDDSILVNRPCRTEGWKIYQMDYDKAMGRWSESSIFEIRRDRWRPIVHAAIVMMILGAISMIILPERKKKK